MLQSSMFRVVLTAYLPPEYRILRLSVEHDTIKVKKGCL
jgi:hypothetical protein